jgi:hypothetical protein
MSKATVTFSEIILNDQTIRAWQPSETHMSATAKFALEHEGTTYPDMSVEMRQPFGTETADPIEVDNPIGSYQRGEWNHNEFRDICEMYFRTAEARAHKQLGIGPNSRNVSKKNVRILLTEKFVINIPPIIIRRIVLEPRGETRDVNPDAFTQTFFRGEGDTDLVCGNCKTILAYHIFDGQIRSLSLECPACGALNGIP